MKIRIEWNEATRMVADIEADSVAEVEEAWEMRYGSDLVDQIEDLGVEIDGGIIWESVTIKEVT